MDQRPLAMQPAEYQTEGFTSPLQALAAVKPYLDRAFAQFGQDGELVKCFDSCVSAL